MHQSFFTVGDVRISWYYGDVRKYMIVK